MSDWGWILSGEHLPGCDVAYPERRDRKEGPVEQWLSQRLGRWLRRAPRGRRRFLSWVLQEEQRCQALDDLALRHRFLEIGCLMRQQGLVYPLLAQALGLLRQVVHRSLHMRPYDVQIQAAWMMLQGRLAQMQTGEGKSLTAALAAATAACSGAAVHVVTVNDYLAERDAQTFSPLYAFLGLSVGSIREGMEPDRRRAAYACSVCYVSNKELVFDYLKDNLWRRQYGSRTHRLLARWQGVPAPLLLRGLQVAIVDEADSVLIDEARTPLILSREQAAEEADVYHQAQRFASAMVQGQHFHLLPERQVELTEAGRSWLVEQVAHSAAPWTVLRWREELMRQALSARHLFKRDQHYLIRDDKIHIIDEFTGRIMADRTWEHGLHQMIEAKEGCEISGGRETLAKMTYQRFFRRYLLLGGMTGTAREVAAELWRHYELPVVDIPTHRPSRRVMGEQQCFVSSDERWRQVVAHVASAGAEGRPVLVGTRSLEASEQLSALLTAAGIAHQVLNARQDQEEAQVVARAGQPGQVTVATNMAGRGTDIVLGHGVSERGGLHVILTEFHTSRRIDRQLFGRCARQGDPGSTEALVSLEDELFKQHSPRWWRAWLLRRGPKPLQGILLQGMVRWAQGAAGLQEARIRDATAKADRQQDARLAFTGRPD